jgi:hypothetical protein
MKIKWATYDQKKVGYTEDGTRFTKLVDGISGTYTCVLYGGGFGWGETIEKALEMAQADRIKKDKQRQIIKKANLTVE